MIPVSVEQKHVLFITGRLAEPGLTNVVSKLAEQIEFRYSLQVMPISVAALMTPNWIAERIQLPADVDLVVIPGYCDQDVESLQEKLSVPIHVGPKDYRELPVVFGQTNSTFEDYGDFSIEIIAEINHAPRMELSEILEVATRYARDGADVIDVGCDPNSTWSGVGACVRSLRDMNLRVSIDSFNPNEVLAATSAGAELVLSVNSTNRIAAADWGCEVVAIPDEIPTLGGLDSTLECLDKQNVPFRIDPIIEPIGCGFAASLARYLHIRNSYPDAPIMMGIGNLTELTDVDSAGINVLLLGFCEELKIQSVLTTEVINWARSSVKECDLARRLVHYAVQHQTPPKHREPDLIQLRDERLFQHGIEGLQAIRRIVKDSNYRVFAEDGLLHLFNSQLHLTGDDPFVIFRELMATSPKNIDASHAFYLGYELSKAMTALTLGKQYRQDEALNWGFLTRPEISHRSKGAGKGQQK